MFQSAPPHNLYHNTAKHISDICRNPSIRRPSKSFSEGMVMGVRQPWDMSGYLMAKLRYSGPYRVNIPILLKSWSTYWFFNKSCEIFAVKQRSPHVHRRFLLSRCRRITGNVQLAFVWDGLSATAFWILVSAFLVFICQKRWFGIVWALHIRIVQIMFCCKGPSKLTSNSSRRRFVLLAMTSGAKGCAAAAACRATNINNLRWFHFLYKK